ncbi:gas vesicle protein K [Carboxydochorda subterranea]|uniref:Gas vesicle protein K n=1 Tax=Carboxydichorda subterranea TaxID=3109565 RepID=A0ABZ1BXV3_9FIRM|nr:gas vesicle protein K [Limnochorda sp. L945t]WRP17418.1 gas vesicle protein K [Limnochorda sp. L945t]
MALEVDADNLKKGLLGLVVTLVEVIRDVLVAESVKRMKGGSLSSVEAGRLGQALMDLDQAIEQLKSENGLHQIVRKTRRALDDLVDDTLTRFVDPKQWEDA